MKQDFSRIVALVTLFVALVIIGCRHEPNPPTEEDAVAVAKKLNRCVPVGNESELVSLKKTNGQIATANGVEVYTFYYTATKKHLMAVGIHPPGWVETWSSNYPFQWTEKGWLGPDGQVYPEH